MVAPGVLIAFCITSRNHIKPEFPSRILHMTVSLSVRYTRGILTGSWNNRLTLRFFQTWKNLFENANAFSHFLHPNQIAIIDVTVVADCNIEIEFRINAIRIGTSYVKG